MGVRHGHTTKLIFLSDIFYTKMCSYDVCSFFLIFQCLAHLLRSAPFLAIDADDL